MIRDLFISELRVLNISSFSLDDEVFTRMPNSMCSAAKIKSLSFFSVELPEGNSRGELDLSCPCLEVLRLSFCRISHLKHFTISAPLLVSLELYDSDRNAKCNITANSQNLKSLKCKGSFHGDYAFENLSSLVSADIDMTFVGKDKRNDKRLIKVLAGVRNVHSLAIPMRLVKEMMLSLDKGEGLGDASSLDSAFPCLKTVEIKNSIGSTSELKFIAILLERVVNMKKININAKSSMRESKKFTQFRKKLFSLPHVSSDLVISVSWS
ncbi:hypothetical protein IFM89_011932 [Coptis chinensis]|uniref:Uncharacterized protein n=1 Tax=Coptis chinensis TaxID=261450 RepID=A0A835H339_9MAGN|nr:hypothetical protein IFM89_011932 [Coptis chinensis]